VDTPSSVVPNGPLVVGVDESERSRDAIALGRQLAEDLPGGLLPVYVHTVEELDALMTGHHLEEVEELVAEHAKAKHAQVRALAAEMGPREPLGPARRTTPGPQYSEPLRPKSAGGTKWIPQSRESGSAPRGPARAHRRAAARELARRRTRG
jgi:hypothetical protein